MKKFPAIFVLLITIYQATFAQKTVKKEKVLIHPALRSFFRDHPAIKEIEFSWNEKIKYLSIDEYPRTLPVYSFDMNFIGDRYLFQRFYGSLAFPDSLLTKQVNRKAYSHNFSGTIRQDTIWLKTEHYFIGKGELVFERIIDSVKYIAGIPVLARELGESIKNISPREKLTDSVFIFLVLIKTDSTAKVQKQVTSENIAYANALSQALNTSGPWKPFRKNRNLNVTKRVYIRLNPDKTVTIVIDND